MRIQSHVLSLPILLLAYGTRVHKITDLATQSDEGLHLTVASQLVAGRRLYLDLFENRTPGVEWLLATLFRLTGPDLFVGRILTLGMAMLSVASLFSAGLAISRMMKPESGSQRGSAVAIVASITFALSPLPIFWARFTMLEHFQAAAYALSMTSLMWAVYGKGIRYWAASGLMAGLAILAKQSGSILALAVIAFLLFRLLRRDEDLRPKLVATWFCSLMLPIAGLFAVLIAQGSVTRFFHFLSGVDRLRFTPDQITQRMSLLIEWSSRNPVLPLALIGALIIVWRRHSLLLPALYWAVLELSALLLAQDFQLSWAGFSHYVIPSMVPLSLVLSAGLVQAWQTARTRRSPWPAVVVAAFVFSALVFTMPGCIGDLIYAVDRIDYPEVGFVEEEAISQAISIVTNDNQAILVLGNAIFYARSKRSPANLFFHYPAYIPGSDLAQEAAADLRQNLSARALGAVLVSGMYLNQRLPPDIRDDLWRSWSPAAKFPYPYQSDMLLFLPRMQASQDENTQPLATFDSDIHLLDVSVRELDDRVLLVGLTWSASSLVTQEYTVFVHLVNSVGEIVAQHDGQPELGYKPTTFWSSQERVVDWHWIDLPDAGMNDGQRLNVGLYSSETGERVKLRGSPSDEEVFTILTRELSD